MLLRHQINQSHMHAAQDCDLSRGHPSSTSSTVSNCCLNIVAKKLQLLTDSIQETSVASHQAALIVLKRRNLAKSLSDKAECKSLSDKAEPVWQLQNVPWNAP